MSLIEDSENFNDTGLRGLLNAAMKEHSEGYIRELPGGWRGEEISQRPAPGSGHFLHYRQGHGVLRYSNEYPLDERVSEFRVVV